MDGFGCELDIRDCEGQLVISHDLPTKPYLLYQFPKVRLHIMLQE